MIRDLVFLSPTRKAYRGLIAKNTLGQSALWKYGISGDLPIVLVTLGKIEYMKRTSHRCHDAPKKLVRIAAIYPLCASETTSEDVRKPRTFKPSNNC